MDEKQITTEPVKKVRSRWFRLTPDRFVLGLLLVVCLLWLSERFQWFGFNHHKGWTVLIAGAAVGFAVIIMLLWWAAGLIFRWRFQFGIRSVLAFCLASSVAVSWLAVEMQQARRQEETVVWVRSLFGGVSYDWEVEGEGGPHSRSHEPRRLGWLRKMLGVDFFSEVAAIYLVNGQIMDAALEHLKGLNGLTHVGLDGTNVTDAGLKCLNDLHQLEFLSLCDTQVTDAGLEHIKSLTHLKRLNLNDTEVTDAGLENLTGLSQLQWLDLSHTTITDAGLKHLKGLTELQDLWLSSTGVTDAGLKHLEGLTKLRQLWLSSPGVTDAGVKKLQQALPNCRIDH